MNEEGNTHPQLYVKPFLGSFDRVQWILLFLNKSQLHRFIEEMKSFALIILFLVSYEVGCLKRMSEDTGPHKGEEIACKGTSMELNSQMMAVKCMPRKDLMKLRPDSGYYYIPNVVAINRCGGRCGSNLSCMPMETRLRPVVVQRHQIVNLNLLSNFSHKTNSRTCYRVYVEEHTKCKCGCNVMETDCNNNQIYVKDECDCVCMNSREQFECGLMKGMIWDPKKCKCTCAMDEEKCSTGLKWIPALCRCGKVMAMPEDEV